ncbi:MAG: STAS domain-containing protein [Armatimonadota bacterium]|nr:STAS domain-containing protein [Armatimonadota bacterium]
MDLETEKSGDFTLVTPNAEYLDASNVDDFKRDMAPILDMSNQLLIDMTQVQFMDSSGLGALLSCMRRMETAGGDLKLFGLTEAVRGTFHMTRMHRIFDIFDTREQAEKAFQK